MARIQLRRGTATEWAAENPVLAPGEVGVELDTGYMKVGNGTATWTARPYQQGPRGLSAYEVAVAGGFEGTESQWLASLASTVPGPPGDGLQIDGTVATYADLPAGGVVEGEMWLTLDTGRLYIYDGTAFPPEVDGIDVKGPPGTTSWDGITDKPSTFPPAAHTHTWDSITEKPAVIAAGSSATAARDAIGAFAASLAPALVSTLPATPTPGKLYCLPES
ncbi:hypothetical protein [Rhodococcus pyridinivorans]|uniref:Major tropism determinant N-terminal domain-containing protein n=1 Tax=Rhodococcus pyridinivorans AK37 TaxID=1114960 RepID=H0JYP1_9NOCA|nr:hypothetical protein [Rhodococcus pyridinivorans]EHK80486.1 hypothetical protein AK37_24429 [Rhodococcus pyridinivorans AK37]MCD2142354.1 hypothetical protein [Rhodococcus pyridinivorans]